MGKLVSAVIAGVVGVLLAVGAAFAVVSSSTAAPSKNPASENVVQYGDR